MAKILHLFKKYGWILFLVLLLGSRFFNLDNTARFTRDESSDLARMHEYWSAKKITLVGPISNDNVKVFGSLTYYMLMPFAVLGNFDPVSTACGAAFWGVATALLLLLLVKKTNASFLPGTAILILIWYPLLESSRWAWNPHLMPFWFAAGLVVLLKPNRLTSLLAGLFIGLAFHNHYIAMVTGLLYLLIQSGLWVKNKHIRLIPFLWMGFSLAILPFVLFDLRHPPGLFIAGYIGHRAPHVQEITSVADLFGLLWRDIYVSFFAMARTQFWAFLLLIATAILIITDSISKKLTHLLWLFPPIGLLVASVFLDGFETRYFFAAIVFYFMWLIQCRSGLDRVAQYALLGILLVSSLLTSPILLQKPQLQPSTKIIKLVSDVIIKTLADHPEINNANITTDMSEDTDMLSLKYRDYLSVRGVTFRAASEYDVSENLFVITQANEVSLLTSVSYPLLVFRDQKIRQVMDIPNSNWRVYWFSY